jgi:hypothetical protein
MLYIHIMLWQRHSKIEFNIPNVIYEKQVTERLEVAQNSEETSRGL